MASREYLKLVEQAQRDKINLVKETQKQISSIYSEASENLYEKALNSSRGGLSERWALDYKKSIESALKQMNNDIYSTTKKATENSASIPVYQQMTFFNSINDKHELGLDETFRTVLSKVPSEAISEIMNGQMYKDRQGLSERIWQDTKRFEKDIDYILARGIAEKKSVQELAKDLEIYVDPKALKPWDFSKVYPNLRMNIDYNTQRIARTSINHSFFMSNKRACEGNPFITAMHWRLSDSHFDRQVAIWGEDICDEHTKQNDYGLGTGNFPVDKLPVPHPQCLCSQYAVIPKSMEQIGKELNEWLNGANRPDIDSWLGENRGKSYNKAKKDDIIKKGRFNKDEDNEYMVYLGKLNINIYKGVADNLISDDLIITKKQISHIEKRHKGVYKKYGEYFFNIVDDPDYVFKDTKNSDTALICKKISDGTENVCLILKLSTDPKKPTYKNSIITAHELSDKQLAKYVRNKKTVYIRE